METLVKKLNVEIANNNLPVLEDYDVFDVVNATLVQNTDYAGNSAITISRYSDATKFLFCFYVDESVVSQYRIYTSGGIPFVGSTIHYKPNKIYEVSRSELNPSFFSGGTKFGPLVNDPAPLSNGSGTFEIYAITE